MRNIVKTFYKKSIILLLCLTLVLSCCTAGYANTSKEPAQGDKEFLKHKRIAEKQHLKAIEEGNKAVEESESFILSIPKDGDVSALWYNYWYTPQYDYESNGGSGVGVSYANAYAPYGTMDLMSRAEGYGSFWAHTRLWVRFTLDGPTDTYKIDCEHLVRGVLTALNGPVGANGADVKLQLRVYDHATSSWAKSITLFYDDVTGIEQNSWNFIDVGGMYVTLYNGHNYSIQLWADVTADGLGQAVAGSDFEYGDRVIGWNWVQCGDV